VWCITFNRFSYVEPFLHSGINPTCCWWIILLLCCWIWLAQIFASVFIRNIGIIFFSFLVCLGYLGNADPVKLVWKFSLFFSFWKGFSKYWY
jgi:hypothetical protein